MNDTAGFTRRAVFAALGHRVAVVAVSGICAVASAGEAGWRWQEALVPDAGFDLDAAEVARVTSLGGENPRRGPDRPRARHHAGPGGLSIEASQCVIQHIAVRPGDAGQPKRGGWEPDGITTAGRASDVWIDHCSATWAVDENLSASSYGAPDGQGARPEQRDPIDRRIVGAALGGTAKIIDSQDQVGGYPARSMCHAPPGGSGSRSSPAKSPMAPRQTDS